MYINKLMVKASLVAVLMSTVGSLSIQAMEHEEDRGSPARAAAPVGDEAAEEASLNPQALSLRMSRLEAENRDLKQKLEDCIRQITDLKSSNGFFRDELSRLNSQVVGLQNEQMHVRSQQQIARLKSKGKK